MSGARRDYYQTHVSRGTWDQPPEWADTTQHERTRLMDMRNAFESKYLKAGDLATSDGSYREVTATINEVKIETLKSQSGEDVRPVIYFQGKQKGMVLNVTNNNSIINMYGYDSDEWVGKAVTIYVNPDVEFGGKTAPALRIRNKRPTPQQPSAAAPTKRAEPVYDERNPPPGAADKDFDDDIPF